MPIAPADRVAVRRAWALVAAVAALAPSVARADNTPAKPVSAVSPEAHAQAESHYARARELYQEGAYREAIGELEKALTFDPNGKDLVFNLGVVHEKLGDIDEALKYFRRYEGMDLDAKERTRAEANIKRLEGAGARHEVDKPTTAPDQPPQPPPPPPPPPPPAPVHGRIDVFTVGAGVVAVGGLGVGIGFGLRALSLRPQSGFVTGRDGSFAQLQNDASKAHKDAIISDIGFGVGLVGAVAATYLYFARTRDPQGRSTSDATSTKSLEVGATVLPGGGALILGGYF